MQGDLRARSSDSIHRNRARMRDDYEIPISENINIKYVTITYVLSMYTREGNLGSTLCTIISMYYKL